MIVLSPDDVIASGNERDCYQHPDHPDRVIKVTHTNLRRQNAIEWLYYQSLNKRNVPATHISNCFGHVTTSVGDGLQFSAIRDDSGELAKSLRYSVVNNHMAVQTATSLLDDLREFLITHGVAFADVSLENIVYDGVRLVVIDGLGSRRNDWRLRLRAGIPWFGARKTAKQWRIVEDNVSKAIARRDSS